MIKPTIARVITIEPAILLALLENDRIFIPSSVKIVDPTSATRS